jgi:hypothetical protein
LKNGLDKKMNAFVLYEASAQNDKAPNVVGGKGAGVSAE